MRRMLCLFLLMVSGVCSASISDCSNVYVGMIWVQPGGGLFAATFHNSPSDTSGSNWQYFTSAEWSADDRKAALALLTTAKIAHQPLSVTTTGPSNCSITSGWYYLRTIVLAGAS